MVKKNKLINNSPNGEPEVVNCKVSSKPSISAKVEVNKSKDCDMNNNQGPSAYAEKPNEKKKARKVESLAQQCQVTFKLPNKEAAVKAKKRNSKKAPIKKAKGRVLKSGRKEKAKPKLRGNKMKGPAKSSRNPKQSKKGVKGKKTARVGKIGGKKSLKKPVGKNIKKRGCKK